jgi:hypothetical protein
MSSPFHPLSFKVATSLIVVGVRKPDRLLDPPGVRVTHQNTGTYTFVLIAWGQYIIIEDIACDPR